MEEYSTQSKEEFLSSGKSKVLTLSKEPEAELKYQNILLVGKLRFLF